MRRCPASRFAGTHASRCRTRADAAWACDELTPDATALGAINVVILTDDGRLRGSSTDGEGFLRSVRDEGFDPAGTDVLVAGAGGAARAIVARARRCGCAGHGRGAPDSTPPNRPPRLVPGGAGRHAESTSTPGSTTLVVNATPLGMQGETAPVDVERLNPGQLVVDTVYHPMETPFLAAARARGVPAVNGLGMLVHQAALAFESWTGLDAPVAAMRVAAARRRGTRRHDRGARRRSARVARPRRRVAPRPGDHARARASNPSSVRRSDDEPPAVDRRRRVVVTVLHRRAVRCALAARFDDSWVLPAYLVLAGRARRARRSSTSSTYLLPNRIVYPLARRRCWRCSRSPPPATATSTPTSAGSLAGVVAFAVFFVLHMSRRAAWASAT